MIQANKKAFSNLIEEHLKYNDVQIEDAKRFIKTQADEKEWLQEVKSKQELVVTPEIRLVLLEFDSNTYIAIIGINNIDISLFDDNIFEDCGINAGILTYLLSEKYTKIGTVPSSV